MNCTDKINEFVNTIQKKIIELKLEEEKKRLEEQEKVKKEKLNKPINKIFLTLLNIFNKTQAHPHFKQLILLYKIYWHASCYVSNIKYLPEIKICLLISPFMLKCVCVNVEFVLIHWNLSCNLDVKFVLKAQFFM